MNQLYFSFQCFVIGYVYAELLIRDGQLLHAVYKFIERKLTFRVRKEFAACVPDEVKSLPGYVAKTVFKIEEKKHWLLKVLGGCTYCTCGQLCLWAFLFRRLVFPILPFHIQPVISTAWQAIFSISATLFMVITYKKINEQWSRM